MNVEWCNRCAMLIFSFVLAIAGVPVALFFGEVYGWVIWIIAFILIVAESYLSRGTSGEHLVRRKSVRE